MFTKKLWKVILSMMLAVGITLSTSSRVVAIPITTFSDGITFVTYGADDDPTPLQFLQGVGINFALSFAGSLLANILTGQLGITVNPNTSLSATNFTNANVYTSFELLAWADGNQDKTAWYSSSPTASVPFKTVSAISPQYPGTNAKIGGKIERGLIWDTVSVGEPLEVKVQSFPPGPPSTNRTTAAAFGFAFANGKFWTGGQEKSAIVPIPEPSTMLLLGSGLAGIIGFGRKRLFKKT